VEWWKRAAFYQLYVPSFQDGDGDGDGFGDLHSVEQHLDYLERLGVDAVWFSPVYRSTLLDCVPQHTSSGHPCFGDTQTGRGAEHRDCYLWADTAADGGPPNKWACAFGGPAWTRDPASGSGSFGGTC
jgi:alpha-glucosidase